MKTLEELWYGNIEPSEYDTSSDQDYRAALKKVTETEGQLLVAMTEEEQDLFINYQDSERELQSIAECLLFQNSFRLGARVMLEIMAEK